MKITDYTTVYCSLGMYKEWEIKLIWYDSMLYLGIYKKGKYIVSHPALNPNKEVFRVVCFKEAYFRAIALRLL